ncbi:hypothetical protein MMC2321_03404 [Chitinophaga sp. MM2321]
MADELNDLQQEERPLLQRLRNSIFPVKPGDVLPVKMLKHSGFYLFAVMFLLISLVICGAVMFVL